MTPPNTDRPNVHIYGVGVVGAIDSPDARVRQDVRVQQIWTERGLDLPRLAEELARLHTAMKQEAQGTREQDKAIVAVADAEEAAAKGDGQTALQHLKTVGRWTLGIAEKIGVALAVEAIKKVRPDLNSDSPP